MGRLVLLAHLAGTGKGVITLHHGYLPGCIGRVVDLHADYCRNAGRLTSQGRDQLAEDRHQWEVVDSTLRGIWQSIAVASPPLQGA